MPDADDHDILIELKVKADRLISDVEGLRVQSQTQVSGIESRVRALENFRWWILGATAILSVMGGAIGQLLIHRS